MWTTGLNVTKVTDRDRKKQQDQLVLEKLILVKFNNEDLVTLGCSPQQEKELVLGYLKTKGYIQDYQDVLKITVLDSQEVKVETQQNLNVIPSTFNPVVMSSTSIFQVTAEFQEKALLFKKTAITHSAAIVHGKDILCFAEDVYRLSAFDKVIGQWMIKGSPSGCWAITSGKIDLTIINKMHQVGMGLILSRTAPTTQAYHAATQFKIGLIGFSRGKRFNVYTPFFKV